MADDIYLSEFIEQLRSELQTAMDKGGQADLKFLAKTVELELEVAAQKTAGVDGKLEFKVFGIGFGAGGTGERSSTQTQRLTLTLEPVGKDGKSPYITGLSNGRPN